MTPRHGQGGRGASRKPQDSPRALKMGNTLSQASTNSCVPMSSCSVRCSNELVRLGRKPGTEAPMSPAGSGPQRPPDHVNSAGVPMPYRCKRNEVVRSLVIKTYRGPRLPLGMRCWPVPGYSGNAFIPVVIRARGDPGRPGQYTMTCVSGDTSSIGRLLLADCSQCCMSN